MLDQVRGGLHVQQVVQHERLAARLRGRQPGVVEAIGKMINTSLSCVPPIVQLAGQAALEHDAAERDEVMQRFRKKVELLVDGAATGSTGVKVLDAGRHVLRLPERRRRSASGWASPSHGLAMYLLEGADDEFGVACLGGECFGAAGAGLPPLQLRRARRTADRAGPRVPAQGNRTALGPSEALLSRRGPTSGWRSPIRRS